jgi:hypothetical protein
MGGMARATRAAKVLEIPEDRSVAGDAGDAVRRNGEQRINEMLHFQSIRLATVRP